VLGSRTVALSAIIPLVAFSAGGAIPLHEGTASALQLNYAA
jgi:hypothetical protein